MKQIPLKISSLETLINENFVFIDKTNFIEKFENSIADVILFLRPRRFGKTIFTEILQYYYDQALKDQGQELLKNTYIDQHPTPLRNSYYVVKFDFVGVQTNDLVDRTIELFKIRIIRGIKKFYQNYLNLISLDLQIYIHELNEKQRTLNNDASNQVESTLVDPIDAIEQFYSQAERFKSPADILEHFLSKLPTRDDFKLLVIIDEYDHFMNNIVSSDQALFTDLAHKNGELYSFFGSLRAYYTTHLIDRIFITGILPITLDSAVSGFVSDNLSTDPEFNELAGFTDQELTQIINETLNLKEYSLTADQIKAEIKRRYNGYSFAYASENKLYNSALTLDFISILKQSQGLIPPLVITSINNIDYDKLSGFLNLIEYNDRQRLLDTIIHNEIIVIKIRKSLNLSVYTSNFNYQDGLSILFYLGFLTQVTRSELKKTYSNYDQNEFYVKIPNEYFRLHFMKYILETKGIKWSEIESDQNQYNYQIRSESSYLIEIITNSLEHLSRAFVAADLSHENEACLAIAIYACIALKTNAYNLIREFPITLPNTSNNEITINSKELTTIIKPKHYRADLVALSTNSEHENYIFEFKYQKNSNSSDETKEQTRAKLLNEAQAQLQLYCQDHKLKELAKLRRFVIMYTYGEFSITEIK